MAGQWRRDTFHDEPTQPLEAGLSPDHSPPAGTARRSAPDAPLWLLTMISFSGTMGMYIFLPAMPYAARDLGASAATLQLTVGMYLIGLALGQLVYGPLSDQFGRRPVLMAGLALFTAAGLGATWSSDASTLITMRLLQGLGGSAGLVLGRAMVRDTAVAGDAARRMALLNLTVTIGPGIAPVLGAVLAGTLGWRSVLLALALLGVANLLFCWLRLGETRPPDGAHTSPWSGLRGNYAVLLRSRTFQCNAWGGSWATTAMYGLFTATPFILVQQLDRPLHEVGLFLTMLVSGLWFGSLLALRLIRQFTVRRVLVAASQAGLAMAAAFLALVALDQLSLLAFAVLMFAFSVCVGVTAPTALAEAVSVDPAVVGTASGIYGFLQMAVGAACSTLVGLGSDPALSSGVVLVAAGILSQGCFWLGAPTRQPPPGS